MFRRSIPVSSFRAHRFLTTARRPLIQEPDMNMFDLFRAHRLRRIPASSHWRLTNGYSPKIKPLGPYGLCQPADDATAGGPKFLPRTHARGLRITAVAVQNSTDRHECRGPWCSTPLPSSDRCLWSLPDALCSPHRPERGCFLPAHQQ
jgi:hypothetical protein